MTKPGVSPARGLRFLKTGCRLQWPRDLPLGRRQPGAAPFARTANTPLARNAPESGYAATVSGTGCL